MNVQWYPGHMTKAKRQMQESSCSGEVKPYS